MKIPTKETLTRKEIYDVLISDIAYTRAFDIIIFLLTPLAGIGVGIFLCTVYLSGAHDLVVFMTRGVGVVMIVLACPLLYLFVLTVKSGSLSKKYYEEFAVITDELVDIQTETVERRTRHGKIYVEEKVFYFYKHGRYRITGRDNSAFQYSDVGDTFYLVLHHGCVEQVYNTKIYRYIGEITEYEE